MGREWDKLLLDSFAGLSPLVAPRLAFRAAATENGWRQAGKLKQYGCVPPAGAREGRPLDFTVLPAPRYGRSARPQASLYKCWTGFYGAGRGRPVRRADFAWRAMTSAGFRTAWLANRTGRTAENRACRREDILASNLHAVRQWE